jgi:hypothetical protein
MYVVLDGIYKYTAHDNQLCSSGEMVLTCESRTDALSTQGHIWLNNNKMYLK